MTTGPEAGFYADPSIPGYIRYWDGVQWVAGTSRPAPSRAPAGEAAQEVPRPSVVRPPAPTAPTSAPAPVPLPRQAVAPPRATVPPAPQPPGPPVPRPEPRPRSQPPDDSSATMIVPSAYGNRGAYGQGWTSSLAFEGMVGAHTQAQPAEAETAVRVVELASTGSRILARIIDTAIAAVVSAPATVTLILLAHRHDHAYVEQLRLQAKTTYRTLGMDTLGLALWAGALLVVIATAAVVEMVRISRSGQTTGRRLVGVSVVRADTAEHTSAGASLARALTFWLLALLPAIGLLALGGVLWGRPYRQGLHERLSRTISIKA